MLNLVDSMSEQKELTKVPRGIISLISTPGNPFMQSSRIVSDTNQMRSAWVEAGEISSERTFIQEIVNQQLSSAKNALAKAPNSPFLLNSLGLAYLNAGQTDEAVSHFEKALSIKNDLSTARLNLAKAQLVRGNLEGALSIYIDLLKQYPRRSVIHESLGGVYLRLALAQGNTSYLEKAEKHLKESGDANPSSLNNLGIVCMLQGNLRAALGYFKKALTLEPRSAKTHCNIAICYVKEKNYEKAIRHFTSSLSLDKQNTEAAKGLARVYLLGKRYPQAADLLSKYEQTSGNDAQLLELLGEAFFYSKNYQSCLATLSRVREINESSKSGPNDLARVYNNLGCAYTGLGEKTKAEAFYRKAIKASTDVVGEAHTNLVDLYMEQGRFDEAFPILKTIESHSPEVLENPAWRLRSSLLGARHYLYLKDYETSSRYLNEAHRADPTSAIPCVGISYLLSELKGDYDGAIKTIKTGLVHAPTNLMLLNNLAYNYLMKGDVEKGRLVLDNINEQDALENPHLLATRGLLLIKEGGLEEGARLYNQSINMALDKETRAQIRQKKNLELGRYWLGQGKQEKANKFLRNVLDIEGHLDIYKQQAATLLQSC